MHTITLDDLEANFMRITDEIIANGEEIQVTREGKVILTVSPAVREKTYSYVQGRCAGTVIAVGDVMSPVENPDDWEYD